MAQLTFLGAARTVTGSKYLLEHGGRRLLVDCGLFQGLKELRLRNWEPFPVAPEAIDAVVLTHAHLDHVGYLPRLVAQGYRNRVYCTHGTKDLCQLVLPDSGRIQEEDARQANRHHYSKHDTALPLYGESDALRALTHLQPVAYHKPFEVLPGITLEFSPAGHLLGSAFIVAHLEGDGIRSITRTYTDQALLSFVFTSELEGDSPARMVGAMTGIDSYETLDPAVLAAVEGMQTASTPIEVIPEGAAYGEAVEAAEYTFPRRGDAASARGDRRDA